MPFLTNNPFRLNAHPHPTEALHFDSRYLQTFTSQNIVNSCPRNFTYDNSHRPVSLKFNLFFVFDITIKFWSVRPHQHRLGKEMELWEMIRHVRWVQ